MRFLGTSLGVALGCVICCGCGAAKIQELTAEVERQKAMAADQAAQSAQLKQELTASQQKLAQYEEIRRGYEEARTKLAATLKQLAPALGTAESPLPPFEGLKDSNWVGRLAPAAGLAPGLKQLEGELKNLLEEATKPNP